MITTVRSIGNTAQRVALVAASTGFAALTLAVPASASVTPMFVGNCGTEGQECRVLPTVPVTLTRAVNVQFTSSDEMCSDIQAHLLLEGNEIGSYQVGPGQSTPVIFIPASPIASHKIRVRAVGIDGGCNTGTLAEWKGSLSVELAPPF